MGRTYVHTFIHVYTTHTHTHTHTRARARAQKFCYSSDVLNALCLQIGMSELCYRLLFQLICWLLRDIPSLSLSRVKRHSSLAIRLRISYCQYAVLEIPYVWATRHSAHRRTRSPDNTSQLFEQSRRLVFGRGKIKSREILMSRQSL